MKAIFISLLSFMCVIGTGSPSVAASQSVSVSMTFETPLMLTTNSNLKFGVLQAGVSGSYTIDTDGKVTASHGGIALGGTTTPAQITIAGSATQSINISTGNYVAASGVALSAATCNYNGATIANCDAGSAGLAAPGTGKVLKLGVTATVDGKQNIGTMATPSFSVTVVYG